MKNSWETVEDRDVYDCPAGAFTVLGKPKASTLRIVWLIDGVERDFDANLLKHCVLKKRAGKCVEA